MAGIALRTERLALREFTLDDADLLVELDSDPEVMRYLTDQLTDPEHVRQQVLPRLIDEYRRHPGFGLWAAHTHGGEFIGWFHLRQRDNRPAGEVELGYRLRRAAWGRGYATEGSRALLHKGFEELGVQTVYAETMTVNEGSRRVMEKVGLSYRRTSFPDDFPPMPGSEHGGVEYSITLAEWKAGR
jgi:RimJ/RimL family protein N-acetyltransferase